MENSRKYDMAMVFGYIEAFMADGSGELMRAEGRYLKISWRSSAVMR